MSNQPSAVPDIGDGVLEVELEDRYRCVALSHYGVGAQMELVYAPATAAVAQLLPAEARALLEHCHSFQTLDAHAQALATPGAGPDAVATVRRQLHAYAAAGLLLSERRLRSRLATLVDAAPPPAPQPISTIGIPTSDRLDVLRRALISYIEHTQQHRRSPTFVVADDARDAETRANTRRLLRALHERYQVPLAYAGLDEKRAFLQQLQAAVDAPPELLSFALLGEQLGAVTTGANRNALLLHTAGERLMCVDDDTVCRLASTPGRGDRLRLASYQSHAEVWMYPNRETLLGTVPFVERDLLGLHEPLLGHDLPACVAACGGPAAATFEHAQALLLQQLAAGQGRVLASMSGLVGDCGWGSPSAYLFLTGASFERLTRSEQAYRAACTSREVLRAVPEITLTSHTTDLVTTCIGFDNRELLAPFIPVGRGQDTLYGLTLGACFHDGYVAHLPWSVLHMPAEARTFWPGEIVRSASGIHLSLLLTALIATFRPEARQLPGAEGLRRLGRHLEQLAGLPGHKFEELVRLQIWEGASGQLASIEERLRAAGAAPAYWADDLSRYAEITRQALTNPDLTLPLNLVTHRSSADPRATAQRLVRQFGQLLSAWPAIVAAARRLRAQGLRLAQPV